MFGTYWAFRWVPEGFLRGISHPDPIKLDDLISYEREREKVVDNTRRFVGGYPANNVLLYGDRGTGKSSTVKGLLHEFGDKGLRLVEVSREGFKDFPEIMALLCTRPQRFIIFVDDLSFEEYETEYKSLKGLLEGGLQAQPENVLIYATSNRKHLIKETFEDRTMTRAAGDLHPGDAQEEKISLADRFGLVVTFLRPDQKTYLEIVRGLAQKEGISLEAEELETLALRWEMLNNGRSGRTARQFIQDLIGRTNLGEGV
jgi:predicted AAA+ superfamily ATPase